MSDTETPPHLPECKIAAGMRFGTLASCILEFFEWHKKSGKQVAEDTLNHLEDLLNTLELKIKAPSEFAESAPVPPNEPPPPRPSANARKSRDDWRKHSMNLARHRLSMDRWRRELADWQLRKQALRAPVRTSDKSAGLKTGCWTEGVNFDDLRYPDFPLRPVRAE